MQIREMFKKKIDREIEGVVKIGGEDDARRRQELGEYVVTKELVGHLSRFFSLYCSSIGQPTEQIGVWISGFFGSGKSHFLKILSYLIENCPVAGRYPVDFFADKIEDPLVFANMKKAAAVPTDVMLFDIDAKSDVTMSNDKEPITLVLNKVFNEKQGFCGSLPWLADLERRMSLDGRYDAFKRAFRRISGQEWEAARDDFYYEEDAIIAALTEATKMSSTAAHDWCEHAEHDFSIDADRFAKRVKDYLDRQGHDRHIIFFVDEVGQYIGDKSNAMLNLQTVVQELGRQCRGRAWLVVTSQEAIDSVVKVKGNDFSKIMGRFTRLSLSSAFVDEVIKKRILTKNAQAIALLTKVYEQKASILKNLLTFSDKGAEMKKYGSNKEFIDAYPFIPYQFNLLQEVFTGVRQHGASGKNLSQGERSLLGSFQEAAVRAADRREGVLIPFSAFYDTIRGQLDSIVTTVVIHAQQNDQLEDFDVEILKLLFLIKYVKEVPADLENLATLMVQSIDEDKLELKKRIGSALQRLIHQTLVQQNGEEYVFLTNDEQDVNREIKQMHVEPAEVVQQIGEILKDSYPTSKYRYSAHYNFAFNRLIDDRPVGTQSAVIGLKVLTPYYDADNDLNDLQLKAMSMRENNVIFHLPAQADYLDEVEQALKIQAYLRLKSDVSTTETIKAIQERKRREVGEREKRAKQQLNETLSSANVYVNGDRLAIKAKNPSDRIDEAFHTLIRNLYTKIDYIDAFTETKDDLKQLLNSSSQQQTAFAEDIPNRLALQEVDDYVTRMTARRQDPTVKSIVRRFTETPYGWLADDTTALLIRLYGAEEIKLTLHDEYVQPGDAQLFDAFTRRDLIDRVIVSKREKIAPVLLKTVKDLCQTLFDRASVPTDEDGLMTAFKALADQESQQLAGMLDKYRDHPEYPGKEVVTSGQKLLQALTTLRDPGSFYKQAYTQRHQLEDYAEAIKDVKGFFKNQKRKFDSAYHLLQVYEKNQPYFANRALNDVGTQIRHIVKNQSPYGRIQQLQPLCEAFRDQFDEIIEQESRPVEKMIETDWQEVLHELEQHSEIKGQLAAECRQAFIEKKEHLAEADSIAEVIALQTASDKLKVRCMDRINAELAKREKPKPGPVVGPEPVQPVTKKTKTISKYAILHDLKGTYTIKSPSDIDNVVNDLRKVLKQELDDDTIIKLV
ncbi:MAG: BREX system P-loop protein BrxC [Sporolactobacillus sp.]|nr:BREX system P-loop protein BrxC [Sporolactobacillus sp.]